MKCIHGESFEGFIAFEEGEKTSFPFTFGGVEEGERDGTSAFLTAEEEEGGRGGGRRREEREDVFFGWELNLKMFKC